MHFDYLTQQNLDYGHRVVVGSQLSLFGLFVGKNAIGFTERNFLNFNQRSCLPMVAVLCRG